MAAGPDATISDTAPQGSTHGINGNGSELPSANGIPEGTVAPGLSADEMALYDRQIRLWGAKAQEQIRKAKVLLISLRAVGTEIAKNLTLAGISELTIIDGEEVTEEDLGSQFFLREEDIGKERAEAAIPRIQELNPRVNVRADGSLQDLLTRDQTYYAPYNCVIACDHDDLTLSTINTAARFASRPFYAAGIHGFYGYIFADLVAHEFVIEREKSNVPTAIKAETLTRSVVSVTSRKESSGKTIEIVKKAEVYCPLILANSSPLPLEVTSNRRKLKAVTPLLPCLRALFDFQREAAQLPDLNRKEHIMKFTELAKQKTAELMLPPDTLNGEFLKSFMQNIGAEITPTAAFVGGRLSEDVINVLGNREQPIQNFALFDGDSLDGRIYSLFSMPPELMTFDPMMQPAMPLDNGLNGLNSQIPPPSMANGPQVNGNGFSTALPAVDSGASTNAGIFADSTQGNDPGQVI
ncbi:Putative THIF-type NAD/FAD binding, ubiquitin-activating enzyme, ThiF/MoeB/HesA family [Septoria linicola]|uniref:Ubiquitin-like 1-activating enzyme E1A n=1 Tax=Septoria linicola TaxID=215465 RepID=A0A9Q9AKP4_9PEZI|nr:putative THIF-type NAD/FAD binding, ubiquitin-activating enzyme, ThiF/MoeB/HesA family [Septoria linicola]USW51094.1 Putative THIF-type NAD/FAD binding, ubiquitin-activating enzyme, ThiF/MoeB/HesA family [Septoria linicola]